MNARNKLLTAIVSMSVINWCSEFSSKADSVNLKSENKSELVWQEILQDSEIPDITQFQEILEIKDTTNRQIFVCLDTDENSYTHTGVLESIKNPENTVLELPIAQLFQKYWDKPHPLAMSWVWKDFQALLGKWWIEEIDLPQKLKQRAEKITSKTKYEMGDTLRFPLLTQSLEWIFPNTLAEQLKEDWFDTFVDVDWSGSKLEDDDMENSEFEYDIVIKKIPTWEWALALYRNWKLFMTTYVSLWLRSRRTVVWQYEVLWKYPYKRSRKYGNSPMPLALNFFKGWFIHQWDVTRYRASHWCSRTPGSYQCVLHSLLKNKKHTDIFISKKLYD